MLQFWMNKIWLIRLIGWKNFLKKKKKKERICVDYLSKKDVCDALELS